VPDNGVESSLPRRDGEEEDGARVTYGRMKSGVELYFFRVARPCGLRRFARLGSQATFS
jgi:hypothetical protein